MQRRKRKLPHEEAAILEGSIFPVSLNYYTALSFYPRRGGCFVWLYTHHPLEAEGVALVFDINQCMCPSDGGGGEK